MIAGHIRNWRNVPGFLESSIWTEAFEWIENHAETAEDGFHQLPNSGCSIRVMSYELHEREDTIYESHLRTIDLQYSILGGEGIEVEQTEKLDASGPYNEQKDVMKYHVPDSYSAFVANWEGHYCVLYPEDGHQPKRLLSNVTEVKKLVIKIPLAFLI